MRKIPPFRLVLEPASVESAELSPFKWAESGVGHRHQIGGEPPDLIEGKQPMCGCNKPMTFYGQLDSLNDEFALADAGLICVFVCFDCFETQSVLVTS